MTAPVQGADVSSFTPLVPCPPASNDADRLTLISNRQSDEDVISSFAYAVDDTGNRTKLTLANGDYADYLYDDTYQLTREHRKDSGDSTLYYNNFFYDNAGNRTRLEYNDGGGTTTTTYLYNTADQLTRDTVGGTNTDYLYDANGSLTKKDDGTNVHFYAYDCRNRTAQVNVRGRYQRPVEVAHRE